MKPRTRKKLQRIHSDITNELNGCFEPGHEPSLTKIAGLVATGLAVIGDFCDSCSGSGKHWTGKLCETCKGRGYE